MIIIENHIILILQLNSLMFPQQLKSYVHGPGFQSHRGGGGGGGGGGAVLLPHHGGFLSYKGSALHLEYTTLPSLP